MAGLVLRVSQGSVAQVHGQKGGSPPVSPASPVPSSGSGGAVAVRGRAGRRPPSFRGDVDGAVESVDRGLRRLEATLRNEKLHRTDAEMAKVRAVWERLKAKGDAAFSEKVVVEKKGPVDW